MQDVSAGDIVWRVGLHGFVDAEETEKEDEARPMVLSGGESQ